MVAGLVVGHETPNFISHQIQTHSRLPLSDLTNNHNCNNLMYNTLHHNQVITPMYHSTVVQSDHTESSLNKSFIASDLNCPIMGSSNSNNYDVINKLAPKSNTSFCTVYDGFSESCVEMLREMHGCELYACLNLNDDI